MTFKRSFRFLAPLHQSLALQRFQYGKLPLGLSLVILLILAAWLGLSNQRTLGVRAQEAMAKGEPIPSAVTFSSLAEPAQACVPSFRVTPGFIGIPVISVKSGKFHLPPNSLKDS